MILNPPCETSGETVGLLRQWKRLPVKSVYHRLSVTLPLMAEVSAMHTAFRRGFIRVVNVGFRP